MMSNNEIQNLILLNPEEIADIYEGKLMDVNYNTRIDLSNEIRLHSTKDFHLARGLLFQKYPSEPEPITNYKLSNWRFITKTYFQKIINTIVKFQKAEDFNIIYENNTIRDYCENEIEYYDSVQNWFFTIGLPTMLQEPNGVILVAPALEEQYTEDINKISFNFYPQLHIFNSYNVIYYTKDFYFLKETNKEDDSFLYVDKNIIVRIVIKNEKNYNNIKKAKEIHYSLLFEHNFGIIPIVTFGGIPISSDLPPIYESLISGVVPFWDQALLDFSELSAGIKQHVFPDKWRYLMGSCRDCNGSGKRTLTTLKGKETDTCASCGGTGDPPTGMFAEVLIQPGTGLDEKTPIPPLGYVKKDFEPIEFLDKHYKDLIFEGLRAINLEYLSDSPLNQSGRAKEMDRQESNAFLSLVARHSIKNVLLPIYKFICKWLYIDTSFANIEKYLLPKITIPVQFDFILSDGDVILKSAKDAGLKGDLLAEVEKRYINARFENFLYEKTYLQLINKLDPLRGYSVDEKIELYNNASITQLDFVCSANISKIIMTAIETTYGYSFANKKYEEQMKYVYDEGIKILNKIDSDISKQKQNYEFQDNTTLLPDNQ